MILLSYKRSILFFCIFAVLLVLRSPSVYASEVDSYTFTGFIREDAVSEINCKINDLIRIALDEANQDKVLEPEALYRVVNRILGGFVVTHLEEILEQRDDGRFLKVDIRDSIYAELWAFWAPALMLSRKIGGVFKSGEIIIGTDKLGHFVSQGYTYFKIFHSKEEGIEKALLYGINSELTYFGLAATGIFSFGDLVANFQGMRFWNNLLGAHPDILGSDRSPYVQQQNGLWVLVNPVDMRRYFDVGWDERINRNLFRNPLIEDEINTKIALSPAPANFPDPDAIDAHLSDLEEKYKEYSIFLLNTGNFQKEHIDTLRQKLKLALKNGGVQRNQS